MRREDEGLDIAGIRAGELGVAKHEMGMDGDPAKLKTARAFDREFIDASLGTPTRCRIRQAMATKTKNWDAHVVHAEEIARGAGFHQLRDRILELAAPQAGETVVDVGAGTGLLTLALAERVERVWAIDISPSMGEYLRAKTTSAELTNVEIVTASAASLPLVDASADLVVSNYCFHHLDDRGKLRALGEAHRVLRPGGRLVFGDMMFRVSVVDPRDRRVVREKVQAMLRKGPAGAVRLARNGLRFAGRRWERPARAPWWTEALDSVGFVDVAVEVLHHEGGVAVARRPT